MWKQITESDHLHRFRLQSLHLAFLIISVHFRLLENKLIPYENAKPNHPDYHWLFTLFVIA